MRSTMTENLRFVRRKCGFSPVKIDFSDYPKINEVYFFPLKYSFLRRLLWNVATVCLLQSNVLLCWHAFCGFNVTLSKSMKSRPTMYGRG